MTRVIFAVLIAFLLAVCWCAYDDQVRWAAYAQDHHCRELMSTGSLVYVCDGGELVKR